jgi:cytoskeletal protein CcmA (bactofilin family)
MKQNSVRSVLLLSAALLLLAVPAAYAFEERAGETVVVRPDEVVADDLYVGARIFVLQGRVQGDIVVFAQTVRIDGTVDGDLVAFAQTVEINGRVGDDVRGAAFAIILGPDAQVGDDASGAAFSLEAKRGSSVGGVYFAGSQAQLAGDVAGNVRVFVDGLQILGTISGDVSAAVGQAGDEPPFGPTAFMPNGPSVPAVPSGLTIGDGAVVRGQIAYSSPSQATVSGGALIGALDHTLTRPEGAAVEPERPEFSPASLLRRYASLLIVGLLLAWLAPTWVRRTADAVESRPLPSLGWGIVACGLALAATLVILIGMILLAVIFGTLSLGDLVGTTIVLGLLGMFVVPVVFGVALTYGAQLAVSFLAGRWIVARVQPSAAGGRVWPLVVGIAALVLLTAVPAVGGLIGLLVALAGLGGVWILTGEPLIPGTPRMIAPAAPPPAPAPVPRPARPRTRKVARTRR